MKKIIFLLSLIGLFLLLLIIDIYTVKLDLQNKGKITTGKYIFHRKWAKGETNDFIIFINGIKYRGEGGNIKGSSKKIGKFYKIRYSEKFKGMLTAYLDQEIKDTIEILKAGFKIEDILSNKNDTINFREASFKEEVFIIFGIKK